MTLQLFTCRYQRFRPALGLAVRTTVGYPRFTLGYPLDGHAHLVTPTVTALSLRDEAAYRNAYLAQLDETGPGRIQAELTAIAEGKADQRLVLLCFDDLSRPDGWCHRRMFADWWTKATGEDVPELAEPPIPGLF